MKYAEFAMLPKRSKIERLKRAAKKYGADDFVEKHFFVAQRIIVEVIRARRAGFEQYSMRTIYEFLRHQGVTDGSAWKLNNNSAPKMSRVVMSLIDETRGMFATREKKQ